MELFDDAKVFVNESANPNKILIIVYIIIHATLASTCTPILLNKIVCYTHRMIKYI